MPRHFASAILACFAWGLPAAVLAQEAAVAEEPASTAVPVARHNCFDDFGSPPGGTGVFTEDSRYFYFLANSGLAKGDPSGKQTVFDYNVFGISIAELTPEKLITASIPEAAALITQGNPVTGVTAVIFQNRANACRSGPAQFASFMFKGDSDGRRIKVAQGSGEVSVVSGPFHNFLYDKKKRHLIEFDFVSLQTRSNLLQTPADEIPLYVDQAKRFAYTWRPDALEGPRGLAAYEGQTMVEGLEFNPGDQIVMQRNYFGVARANAATNAIQIIELPKWSAEDRKTTHEFIVPEAYDVREAEVKVHFGANLAVLSGAGRTVRKHWNRVMVFDYAKSWQISHLKGDKNQYIGNVEISPDGHTVVAEVKNLQSHRSIKLGILHVKNRRWDYVSLK